MMSLFDKVRKITPQAILLRILEKTKLWCHDMIVRLTANSSSTSSLHVLHLPQEETEDSLFRYLSDYHFENSGKEEMDNYLREDFKRFLYTLQIIPEGEGRLLEIGANPYFMTMLLQKFTRYELHLMNYFSPEHPLNGMDKKVNEAGKEISFPYYNINIETDEIPFPDQYFDVVLCCEVIEHLTHDPMQALANIKQKLKPGGTIVLSTPNVARLENVSRMMAGVNIYDPYSGYGPYGRHNREYNVHEMNLLMNHMGFEVQKLFTADVHPNRSADYYPPERFIELLTPRKRDLGQYIFCVATDRETPKYRKPAWLYRSYPPEELE